jgi:hypothetical protein
MRSASEIQQAKTPQKEVIERPSMREETVRPEPAASEDPRARAAKRAAELRGHLGNIDDGVDKFYAPTAPEGWQYEWKRKTVMGWEDPAYMNNLIRTGWEPVPASRHPEMMQKGYTGAIERDGQVLMERPKEISDEMRRIELMKARQQVNIKAGQMDPKGKGGIISREDAQIAPKISKAYDTSIPEQ